ncbi:MAG TPA: HAMP domain-containing sensor histidine kinase [Actinomycetota bacterium]|nr:HAMP domain-containing sensor histidine kinase [Actinomycetota bacterium]
MSFRGRLVLAYLALLALTLAAFGVGVYAYVDTRLHRDLVSAFEAQAKQYARLVGGPSGYSNVWRIKQNLEDEPRRLPSLYYAVDARHLPQETKDFKDVSVTSAGLTDDALPKVPADGKAHLVPAKSNALGRPLAVYQLSINATAGNTVILVRPRTSGPRQRPPATDADTLAVNPSDKYQGSLTLARDLRDLEASLSVLRKILVAGGLTVLLIGAVVSWALAAGLLRPLGRMRAAAQRIGDERDFASRLPDDDRRDEISRLSKSFNQMLAELEQSHDDLKTTLDAQRRFVGDASHELRTPMTAIRTNLEFLARVPGAREEDRSAALHDILAEMRRMEALVGDLLALARLEATAVGAVRRAVRLDHLLADIHRDASRLAPRGVEVRLKPARLPHVWVSGDRDDLRRAVWNLVDNALKYTTAGHIELRLAVGDGMAELEVRDSGIGIAEVDQRHVFDRFWRSQRTRGMAGSGLGLAITKWVAQAHGGMVLVESVLGEGSVFTLRLPATSARRSVRRPRTPARQAASPAHS